jgi:hypothetical protein
MAVEKGLNPFSWPAAADLSGNQYYCVNFSTLGQVQLAGAGEFVAGILQNDPAAQTRAASVQTLAGTVTKTVVSTTATAAIVHGSQLASSAAGVAIVSTAPYIWGRALETVSTGVAAGTRVISVMITHQGVEI